MKEIINAQWARLGEPGTWWSGEERVAIAGVCRAALNGEGHADSVLADVAVDAASKIATKAHEIDEAYIRDCEDRGLAPLAMVELLSIVCRVAATDTCKRGVGEPPLPMAEPQTGEPGRTAVAGAALNHGWLPTVSRASAPVCFSAVADEQSAWGELHSVLYLGMDEMRDLNVVKDLHRS